ncbi:type II secretion system protein J [Candidatus Omnitrophota bacterium]
MIKKSKFGFTLIETMMSIAIFAIVSVVIYLFFMVGVGSWQIGSGSIDLHSQARISGDMIITELKQATRNHATRGLTIPAVPNNDSITFYLPDKDANGDIILTASGEIQWPNDILDFIQYRYVANNRQLIREDRAVRDGTSSARVLANNVDSVQFIDAGIDISLFLDEVNVILNLQKDTPRGTSLTFSMRSTVKLRN